MISCQCVTYGRVELLEEAIACFLNQTHKDRELVILNTFPEQELVFDHPLISIHNLKERPGSLGEARNMCVDRCMGEWITCWDDDNFYLPRQLEIFASGFSDESSWVRLSKMFYAERFQIQNVVDGEANLFAFRKDAWKKFGGYPSKTCGEDRMLNNKIRTLKGKIINPDEVTHVYSWGNGVYHASGQGDAGEPTVHTKIAVDMAAKIKARLVPIGRIQLKPEIKHDFEQQALKFRSKHAKISDGNLQHAQ